MEVILNKEKESRSVCYIMESVSTKTVNSSNCILQVWNMLMKTRKTSKGMILVPKYTYIYSQQTLNVGPIVKFVVLNTRMRGFA